MLKTILFSLGFLTMFPSFATTSPSEVLKDYVMQEGYSEISQNIAHALIESKQGILIDVRTKEEFDDGHIEGALNIPLETIHDGIDLTQVTNKETPLLLYCRTGRRSTTAGQILVKNGYKYVVNFGGVNTWHYGLVETSDN